MIELSVIILAAGGSTRLGVSKQMINFHGRTLIQLACDRALKLSSNVTVVTGANHHSIEASFAPLKVSKLYNPHWEKGIASSVGLAIKHEFNSQRVLIMHCDQPLIPEEHYQLLKEQSDNHPEKIIATEFDDRYIAPAIFPHRYFYELTTLKGEEGVDTVIEAHLDIVSSISCEQAAFSVDTPADMTTLQKR